MPTETVYGLAGDAFSLNALTKIFATKERPTFDPLIVHIVDRAQLEICVDFTKMSSIAKNRAESLMAAFWPGPLTLVLPKRPEVPDLATSGLPTVAIRMPSHPVARALIREGGTPLAAPSANRFGRISPTRAQDVFQELGDRIGWILEGGRCEVGLESTVVQVEENGDLILLRPGGISSSDIGKIAKAALLKPASDGVIQAPGMLKSHYAPLKPLKILPGPVLSLQKERIEYSKKGTLGLLLFSGDLEKSVSCFRSLTGQPVIARVLSASGNLEEAARNLFAELRFLDASEARMIFAEPCPSQEGLGHAISDRLKRASA